MMKSHANFKCCILLIIVATLVILIPSLMTAPLLPPPQNHQVFINFQGAELRYDFISHLTNAFKKDGINYFIDNDMQPGTNLNNLYGKIDESRIALVAMLMLILIFATVHSGLASLRDIGEKIIGERTFRVLFAGISLPLAMSTIVYFINHRYYGSQLWHLQGVPGIHEANFVSFFFLYPSTFNLLEVAAVDKPKMYLWETGIMRITRHPQIVGQIVWCLAHTLWMGSTVAASASHLFGAWNGDRRLAKRYGEAFESIKKRTSVIPFAAISEGRQVLPEDYYKEFIRLPYLAITALTIVAYFAHPLMQGASFRLHW